MGIFSFDLLQCSGNGFVTEAEDENEEEEGVDDEGDGDDKGKFYCYNSFFHEENHKCLLLHITVSETC